MVVAVAAVAALLAAEHLLEEALELGGDGGGEEEGEQGVGEGEELHLGGCGCLVFAVGNAKGWFGDANAMPGGLSEITTSTAENADWSLRTGAVRPPDAFPSKGWQLRRLFFVHFKASRTTPANKTLKPTAQCNSTQHVRPLPTPAPTPN